MITNMYRKQTMKENLASITRPSFALSSVDVVPAAVEGGGDGDPDTDQRHDHQHAQQEIVR